MSAPLSPSTRSRRKATLTAVVRSLREADDKTRQCDDHERPSDPVECLDELGPRRTLLVLDLEVEVQHRQRRTARGQVPADAREPRQRSDVTSLDINLY